MGPERMYGMTPWVRRLLVAYLVVFLLQETVFVDRRFLDLFGFVPLAALDRPWTFVTYQFLHAGILHLAFNALALFIFGPSVEARMGGRRFLAFYFACGLGGAALSYVLTLLVRMDVVVVGASAAIYGTMLAFAWYWPNEPIHVFPLPDPIPAKWLVTFAVAVSLVLAWVGAQDGVAHLAHLGGFATALVWLKAADWSGRAQTPGPAPAREREVLVSHQAPRAEAGGAPAPRAKAPPAPDRTQAEVDRVLDKISASGLDSLTPAERRFLAEMSRRMRGGGR